jgi:large conductance mechanosensitive channel
MLREFREFLNRGNVIDLAVAVIIGTAFGLIVKSLVDDIIMPLIGIIIGGIDFSSLAIVVGGAEVRYGLFLQALVNFLIVAWVIFLLLRVYNRFKRKEDVKEEAIIAEEILLLREIRDSLRRQGPPAPPPPTPRV